MTKIWGDQLLILDQYKSQTYFSTIRNTAWKIIEESIEYKKIQISAEFAYYIICHCNLPTSKQRSKFKSNFSRHTFEIRMPIFECGQPSDSQWFYIINIRLRKVCFASVWDSIRQEVHLTSGNVCSTRIPPSSKSPSLFT